MNLFRNCLSVPLVQWPRNVPFQNLMSFPWNVIKGKAPPSLCCEREVVTVFSDTTSLSKAVSVFWFFLFSALIQNKLPQIVMKLQANIDEPSKNACCFWVSLSKCLFMFQTCMWCLSVCKMEMSMWCGLCLDGFRNNVNPFFAV